MNGLHTPSIVMKRDLIIPRKNNLGVEAVLYFDGTEDELSSCNEMIFHIPGGGFVCLSPENYNDVLCIMAKKTRKPVLAIKYRKAPEFPFPEGLEECFDVYEKIIKTEGRIIGMKSVESIKMSGDSAGANLVCAVIFMAMERKMCLPDATCLMCPLLTFDVEGWLTSENQNILSNHVPNHFPTKASQGFLVSKELEKIHLSKIEVTSRFKFFNDMILTPEYLLGMALMYLRKYPKAEPAKDHLLSPLNAPEEFLKQFPPTFIQIGDKDPLVDDSLLFYSKLKNFDKSVQLELLEGISHGYLNMLGLLPEGRIAVDNVCSYLK